MRLVKNAGTDRVIDIIRPCLRPNFELNAATASFSLFAFGELLQELSRLSKAQLLLPAVDAELGLFGSAADRASRNRLQARWLAATCSAWLQQKVEVRGAPSGVPQGALVVRNVDSKPQQVVLGSVAFSTDGLGLTPGNPLNLIQVSETADEAAVLSQWFETQWSSLAADSSTQAALIASHAVELEEIDIENVDIDDPAFESLLVGRKVKVLLKDVDLIRWRQELIEDRNRLATLHAAAAQVDAARDAKLAALRDVIQHKCCNPINPGNRKVIVFTAFADTARYLYDQLAPWAKITLGIDTALVTGTGRNQTTLAGQRKDHASILSAFAPRSKERPEDLAGEGELDLLIATDCISEGQNLQDCDWLINYDIHWNPVRIIQRFGRIDRIGSPNRRIQLVNFWPNIELEEYINLEQRVSGRMVLLDISATGEENLIEQDSGNQMNDLEYRRKQLLKLQDAVIDLEDLSTGVSIADLTLTDFRIDLAQYLRAHPGVLESLPLGTCAVTTTNEVEIAPGVIFCLRAEGVAARRTAEAGYPLAPHYLVHVGEDGTVLLPYAQAKHILDRLKRLCLGRDLPDAGACARFDRTTKQGEDMRTTQRLLAAAVASIAGKSEERAVASLFSPGGTYAVKGEFAGINDFEVVAYLVVLAEATE